MQRQSSPPHALNWIRCSRVMRGMVARGLVIAAAGLAGAGCAGALSPEPTTAITSVPPLAPHDPNAIVARSTHEPAPATLVDETAAPDDATSDKAVVTWAYTKVLRYFDAEYRGMPHPNPPKIIAGGETVPLPAPCDGAPTTATDVYYVQCGDSIRIGMSQIRQSRHDGGVAAILLVVGHEMTHHVQHVAGMPLAVGSVNQRQAGEWQADCGAGAFIAAAIRAGFVRAGEVAAATAAVLRPTPPHGTYAERLAAFNQGRINGLFGCNRYSLTIVTLPPSGPI